MSSATLFIFFCVATLCAIVALEVKDLIAAAALLSVFSFIVALIYVTLGAVDVGFNEAVLGAGVNGLFFLVAVYHTTRKVKG